MALGIFHELMTNATKYGALSDSGTIVLTCTPCALGIPFLFATSYGDCMHLPPHMQDVPIIKKPYNRGLAPGLSVAFGRLQDSLDSRRIAAGARIHRTDRTRNGM